MKNTFNNHTNNSVTFAGDYKIFRWTILNTSSPGPFSWRRRGNSLSFRACPALAGRGLGWGVNEYSNQNLSYTFNYISFSL